MKYFVIFLVLVVLIGASAFGVLWWVNTAKADDAGAESTAKVTRGDLKLSVTATGTVASNNDVDIKCRASGEVIKLPYDISDQVEQKAMLITLDKVDQERALEQAKAQVKLDDAKIQSAQMAWEIAKLNLVTARQRAEATLVSVQAKAADASAKRSRTEALYTQKLASKEDLETAQTTAAQAVADVELAKAAIAELEQQAIQVEAKKQDIESAKQQRIQDDAKREIAENAVKYCVVNAPTMLDDPTGEAKWTVAAMTVKIGTLVQSGTSNVSGGTAVMTLSDLSRTFIMATVDESDIGQVEKGQHVNITADSFKGVKFEGTVVRIATKGVSTSNVVTFEVKIEVTSKNRLLLKPMMTANVDIIIAEKKDVLMVPMAAVSRKNIDPFDEHASTTSAPATADAATAEAATAPAATAPAAVASEEPRTKRGGKGGRKPKFLPGPFPGTAQVVKGNGEKETREIQYGVDDESNYEIVSGLTEGETVVLNKATSNSRFSGGRGRGGR